MVKEIPALSEEEINEKLGELSGWKYSDDKISKEFKFEDYNEALNFLDCVSEVFNETDHHPDIHIYYSRVVFELNTHSAGNKVTEVDFIVADEIDRVFGER